MDETTGSVKTPAICGQNRLLNEAAPSDSVQATRQLPTAMDGEMQSRTTFEGIPVAGDAAARWDAQTAFDVGVLITGYLHRHPAPPGAHAHLDLALAGRNLRAVGQRRLDRLDLPHLRVATMAAPSTPA
jgi:hypothetical protein